MKRRIISWVICGVFMVGTIFGNMPDVQAAESDNVCTDMAEWTPEDYEFYMYGSGDRITEAGKTDSSKMLLNSTGAGTGDLFKAAADGMVMSKAGIDFIASKEGIFLDPKDSKYAIAYDDKQPGVILKKDTKIKGTLTIGYGHTGSIDGKPLAWNTRITVEDAKKLMASDIKIFERPINNFAQENKLKLKQTQFDALVSFTYNVGGGVWTRKSDWTLRTMLKNGVSKYSQDEVIGAFELWNTSGGVIMAGLTRRRRQEAAMFLGDTSLSAYKLGTYKVASETLNVRVGAATKYEKAKKDNKEIVLKKNDEIVITEIGNTYWGKYESGWVQLDYCRLVVGTTTVPDNPVIPEQPQYDKGFYQVSSEGLNIREGADTKYKTLGALKKGDRVNITETSGRWGKMSKGWISLAYCEKLTPPSGTTVSAANKKDGILVSWKAVKDVTGYHVYKYIGNTWKKLATINNASTVSYMDTKLADGDKCQYRVYAYTKIDGGDMLSPASPTRVHYRVAKAQLSSAKKGAKGQVKLTWKKNNKASGYEIMYSTDKNFAKATSVNISKGSTVKKTIKKLSSKKVYYFKIRAYRKTEEKRYNSVWSDVKKVTTK